MLDILICRGGYTYLVREDMQEVTSVVRRRHRKDQNNLGKSSLRELSQKYLYPWVLR